MTESSRQSLAKKYERKKNLVFLVDIILTSTGLFLLIIGGKDGLSGRLAFLIDRYIHNVWMKNGIYFLVLNIAAFIYFFPLRYYSGFFLEHRFRLSTQNFGRWFLHQFKAFVVSSLIGLLLVELFYFLLRETEDWWIWAGVGWIFFSIVLSRIAPTVLIPIFYKLTPMGDSHLVERLKRIVHKVGCRVLGVYRIELSSKTKKANAAFTGWGRTRRILLGDTLLQNFTEDEIEVVLAHELGHFYYKHTWKLLGISVIVTFILLYILNLFLNRMVISLGFNNISNIATLPLFLLFMFVFILVTMPVTNGLSRFFETQADRFSIEVTGKPNSFVSCMKKLAEQNLAVEEPNPVIYAILYNHPSISRRIHMAERYKEDTGENKVSETGK